MDKIFNEPDYMKDADTLLFSVLAPRNTYYKKIEIIAKYLKDYYTQGLNDGIDGGKVK